jgi:hypothetical protein
MRIRFQICAGNYFPLMDRYTVTTAKQGRWLHDKGVSGETLLEFLKHEFESQTATFRGAEHTNRFCEDSRNDHSCIPFSKAIIL